MSAPDSFAALRDSDGDPDPYAIVEEFWPYDGPYNQWTTTSAATMIGRLVRYLNNATQKPDGLSNAPAIGQILSGLNAATYGYDQLLDQIEQHARNVADDPTMYDDRDPSGQGGATARELAGQLAQVRASALQLRGAIERASGTASHLGHRSA